MLLTSGASVFTGPVCSATIGPAFTATIYAASKDRHKDNISMRMLRQGRKTAHLALGFVMQFSPDKCGYEHSTLTLREPPALVTDPPPFNYPRINNTE
jgi:hypothetical protein